MQNKEMKIGVGASRVAESEVKYLTPTLTFPKFPTPTLQNF